MFDNSWFGVFNDYYKTKIRIFQLGNVKVRILNCNNKDLLIDDLEFQITPAGELEVCITGQINLNSLQELKDKVNLYRKSYKIMIETSKQLKLMGDF